MNFTQRVSGAEQGIRTALIDQAALFLANRSAEEVDRFRHAVTEVVDGVDAEELARIAERIATTGKNWGYQPPEPFVRRIHWIMADFALAPESALEGAEQLTQINPRKPFVFLANHLSYADAHVVEILLHRSGLDDLASQLTVLAGPKVYSELFRRFSSLCFGTIKTPQSTARSSGEAVMAAREVARIAHETIAVAFERQKSGDSLLIFVEGTRSRGGGMQRALPAVSRYFEYPDALLVPLGIRGSEKLLPVEQEKVHRATVNVRVGKPVPAARVFELSQQSRRCVVDVMGVLIAKLLPAQYQGAYGGNAGDLSEARRIAEELDANP